VRRPHLPDLLAVSELGRERVYASVTKPLQLLAPVTKNVRKLGFFSPAH
jgi:hypothetical protein